MRGARANQNAMTKRFKVKAPEEGRRLDLWLVAKMGHLSRRKIKALIDGGYVQINGRRVVIAGWELEAGDEVVVGSQPVPTRAAAERLRVYYQDRDVIVVEKPAGLPTVPGPKEKRADCLLSRVRSYLRRKYASSRGAFVAPLHRLDVGTSGVVVFALSKAGEGLSTQFRRHSVRREYLAVVVGRPEKSRGVIKLPVEKGNFGGGKNVRVARGQRGQAAVTEYRVVERYPDAALLQVRLGTGRTHQVRVHLAEKGLPLVGEGIYAPGAWAGPRLPFYRHALHASLLGFSHPVTGQELLFRSSLPKDLRALIEKIR